MKKQLLLPLLIILVCACNSDNKKAQLIFDRAQSAFDKGELNNAKLDIDSIKDNYPKAFELIRKGSNLMRKIQIVENQRNSAYSDSLLVIRRQEAQDMTAGFTFLKEEKYEDMGHFVDKSMTVEKNIQKSYLRCGVNEQGKMFLVSVYYGRKNINHTAIKVHIKDGSYSETMSVPYDGGTNYRFKDLGMQSEMVTYSRGADNGVIEFINLYKDQEIKVTFIGEKDYTIVLDKKYKDAICRTTQLAAALADVIRLSQESTIAKNKISDLEQRVRKFEEKEAE